MGKEYISTERLRQFIENIAEAPEATIDEVDYLLCVKGGRLYKTYGQEPSEVYLRVSPEEVQWIYPEIERYYTVESNTRWRVE